MPDNSSQQVSDTLERKKLSKEWIQNNYWAEFEEVYQMSKCRVNPLLKTDGSNKEDTSRTNLCLPDAWIMVRRKSARIAARPPIIKIRAKDQAKADYLTHLARYQWDRGREQALLKRHVMQAEIFGYSVKMKWWDQTIQQRRYRKRTSEVLKQYGISVDTETDELYLPYPESPTPAQSISGETPPSTRQIRPASEFSDEQVANLIGSVGDEVFWQERVTKYDGPVSSLIFLGDLYLEPGCESLNKSAWVIVEEMKDLEWLAYFVQQKYRDPRDPKSPERPAIDPKAAQELVDMGQWSKTAYDQSELRQNLRSAIFKSETQVDYKLIPGKRFQVTSEYTFRDGWPYLRWVGNEKVLLGEIPLPWDLNGMYPASVFTPMPDLISYVGDSSPRMLRHLLKAANVNLGQRMDLITQQLKPTFPIRPGADIPNEIIDRGLFRLIKMDPNAVGQQVAANVYPGAANELARELSLKLLQAEPSMNSYGEQSQAVPASSQVATIATLQQRASDSITQDELDNLNQSINDDVTLSLLMFQSAADQDTLALANRYEASSLMRGGDAGTPRAFIEDPLELQEDFEVCCEAGSTLALDDEERRNKAMQQYQLAMTNPALFNIREAGTALMNTFHGSEGNRLINPEKPPEPPPPAEPKVSISLAIKWTELQGTVTPLQQQILEKAGLQLSDIQRVAGNTVDALTQLNQAGIQLENLQAPAGAEPTEGEPSGGA